MPAIATPARTADVAIIGGGVVGSAIAYFLAANDDFTGSILVIEKDPTYARSSTALSVGGFRQQFSTPENIEISKFGAEFFRSVHEYLSVDEEKPDISLRENGYLFLASPKGEVTLRENHKLQQTHGVEASLLSREQLKERFPWLTVTDLAAGVLGESGEGWIDPYSLLMAFKRKAQALGVSYQTEEGAGFGQNNSRIETIFLAGGGSINCGIVVNAAGSAAARVAEMAGIRDLPVRPRKRLVFTFECAENWPSCPLVVDPSGIYFRPESGRFLCGVSPAPENDPDCLDFKVEAELFYETIWPALANRVPAFEALEQKRAWAGHYAYNTVDQNAILGPHPEVDNFYFANGFSGHGLQQAPAVGRGLSELITYGEFRTLDLGKFAFDRVETGALIREKNVV